MSAFEPVPSLPPNHRSVCLVAGADDTPGADPLRRWVSDCPDAVPGRKHSVSGMVPSPPELRTADSQCYAHTSDGHHLMCKHKLSKESASPDSTGLIRLTVTELVLDWTHGPEPLYRFFPVLLP